jgi:NAD(P)-dependent dehydrogenase (short-subunit alcohol dehydrogenase family)
MKHIVITGSTRGIGYGLVDAFLDLECSVTISGRSQENVDLAASKLVKHHSLESVLGIACDVRNPDQVQTLWDQSISQFNKIDIWINNAGFSGPQLAAWETPPEKARGIIETNLLGEIYGSMVAARGMLAQGYGAIYNMEGMGSDGRMHTGLTYYGTSNAGRNYFNSSLIKETEGTPLIIGTLRPGMVVTDLLTKQYEDRPEDWEKDKRIFNILADRVETVCPWLAEQMLNNDQHGAKISWTSRWKIMGRFLTSPFSKRNVFEEPTS